MDRRHIARTIKRLIVRQIITQTGNGYHIEYAFQKDYSLWKPLPKQVTEAKRERCLNGDSSLPKQATEALPKQANTKEKKETIQKKLLQDIKNPALTLENEQVKQVFEGLKERRQYDSPRPGAEAKAIRWMLKHGYKVDDILGCWDRLKAEPFWQGKPLFMMSAQKQIGEWQRNKQSSQQGEEWRMR